MINERIEGLKFLDQASIEFISRGEGNTPVFVYSQKLLKNQAEKALAMPNAYGLTVRYAMKANPNRAILKIFDQKGIQIDASSEYEVERAVGAGIDPKKILLTTQQLPRTFHNKYLDNVEVNLTSLNQIEDYANFTDYYGVFYRGNKVSIRINPGIGSGGNNRTNVGGSSSSFGIWHENFDEALEMLKKYDFDVKRLHFHIGSGSDPEIWKKVAEMPLAYGEKLLAANHNLEIVNLGGGYKVGRMNDEETTDLYECGKVVVKSFEDFYSKTGVKLKLEIEPGTFLVANAGSLITKVIDIVKTSDYEFIKIDAGMTEITRPSLYGAQHPIIVVPNQNFEDEGRRSVKDYIVVGHCCESGDILTPGKGDPESLKPRRLLEARIGDYLVIEGVGAYCSSMSTKNYNSFPEASEVLIDLNNNLHVIRKRQTLDQIAQNEIIPEFLK